MDNKRETKIYQDAVNKWGEPTQAFMAMGECGELTAALARFFVQGRGNDQEVIDEIADVQIMLNQLKLMFMREAVEQRKIEKLLRLEGILGGDIKHPHG